MVFLSGIFAFKSVLLLVVIFQVTIFVVARPQTSRSDNGELLTNAQRFRAGLPPLAPKNLYSPTRLTGGGGGRGGNPRPPTTSPAPSLSGNILVKKSSNGGTVGYVEKTLLLGDIGVTNLGPLKLSVSFTPDSSPFSIAISGQTSYPYLGFSGKDLLSTTPLGFGLAATNPTSPNQPSKLVGNALGGYSQSAIWSYSSTTKSLTPQWVNSDGSKHSVYVWYFPLLDKLRLVRTSQLTGYQVSLFLA